MKWTQQHFCAIPTKGTYPVSIQEETSNKPKLRDILQNNWPIIVKCQGHENQGTTEELFQIEGDERDMTTKCNIWFWPRSFCYAGDPWTTQRLGETIPCIVENLHITLWLALRNCGSTSADSTNCRSCSTVVFIEKKYAYKWAHAVQTCVVQGPAVSESDIIGTTEKIWVGSEDEMIMYQC